MDNLVSLLQTGPQPLFACPVVLVYQGDSKDIAILKTKLKINLSALLDLRGETNTEVHMIAGTNNSEGHSHISLVKMYQLVEVKQTVPRQKEQNQKTKKWESLREIEFKRSISHSRTQWCLDGVECPHSTSIRRILASRQQNQ